MSKNKEALGKPCFSIPEMYTIAVKAFKSAKYVVNGQKSGLLPEALRERIMLAVTSVNKCAMCSYAHTEMALQAGLSQEEIKCYLDGDFENVPEEYAEAVLFAQHYADRRGHPSKDACQALVKYYGLDKARCIVAAARIIMLGNAGGMVLSSIKSRIHGEGGDPRSSIPYEITAVLALAVIMPTAFIHASLSNLLHINPIKL